jgi:hypothetical protein
MIITDAFTNLPDKQLTLTAVVCKPFLGFAHCNMREDVGFSEDDKWKHNGRVE